MALTPTQEERAVRVVTSLGTNTLLFSSMSGSERLSTLYNYRLELISLDHQINLDDLLGTDITVELELPPSEFVPQGAYRYFNGTVADCAHIGGTDEYAHYEFSVRPWFWLLTRTSDCRIFQEMTVPDIIKQVFGDSGFPDFEDSLTGSYEPWRYCVQYRETDYNFLSRLMEQEGIYFFFRHENGKNTLVLSDGYSAHSTFTHYDSVPYFPVESGQLRERDHFQTWQLQKQLQPGKFAARDYNFETPKANMLAQRTMAGAHANANYEVYDYPGVYPGSGGVPLIGTGEVVARHRIEEIAAQHETASGGGNAHGMCAGYLFSLTGCERKDQNREYLIVESRVEFSMDSYRSGSGSTFEFHGSISAMNSQQQFRAPRVTHKPMVQGPQTAMVVGAAGEEIWTDEYGRVKLQFHWDRYGQSDENSSCWVRVSQAWAGSGWGGISIPRIGQEVIVDFINGDPDRPIITGRVYNGDNMPPYNLPAEKVVSGMKTATHKGGGYNEISMNDTDQSQLMRVHAQYDMDSTVLNDLRENVGINRTRSVGTDESISIGNNRKLDVTNDEAISVGNNRDTTVTNDESAEVGNNSKLAIGNNSKVEIGNNMNLDVGATKTETVAMLSAETIGAAKTLNVGAGYQVGVGAAMNVTVGGASMEQVGLIKNVSAGKKIELSCGSASITLESAGKVTISGTSFDFTASGPVKINGLIIDLN